MTFLMDSRVAFSQLLEKFEMITIMFVHVFSKTNKNSDRSDGSEFCSMVDVAHPVGGKVAWYRRN